MTFGPAWRLSLGSVRDLTAARTHTIIDPLQDTGAVVVDDATGRVC